MAVWKLFSNRKSLECDVCAQRWLNVVLRSPKILFLTSACWCYGWCALSKNRNKVLDLL